MLMHLKRKEMRLTLIIQTLSRGVTWINFYINQTEAVEDGDCQEWKDLNVEFMFGRHFNNILLAMLLDFWIFFNTVSFLYISLWTLYGHNRQI